MGGNINEATIQNFCRLCQSELSKSISEETQLSDFMPWWVQVVNEAPGSMDSVSDLEFKTQR